MPRIEYRHQPVQSWRPRLLSARILTGGLLWGLLVGQVGGIGFVPVGEGANSAAADLGVGLTSAEAQALANAVMGEVNPAASPVPAPDAVKGAAGEEVVPGAVVSDALATRVEAPLAPSPHWVWTGPRGWGNDPAIAVPGQDNRARQTLDGFGWYWGPAPLPCPGYPTPGVFPGAPPVILHPLPSPRVRRPWPWPVFPGLSQGHGPG